jgi:hypothetical protein
MGNQVVKKQVQTQQALLRFVGGHLGMDTFGGNVVQPPCEPRQVI